MSTSETHPLIDELKSDLEVAFDHFKRTSAQLTRVKRENRDESVVMLSRSELGVCFDLLNTATERFNLLNDLYATVIAAPDQPTAIAAITEQLKNLDADTPATRKCVNDFVRSLSDFLAGRYLSDSNRIVRHSWQQLEAAMVSDIGEYELELQAAQR